MRPLAYPDSDAVLICFDISRPETLDSVLKKVTLDCVVEMWLSGLRGGSFAFQWSFFLTRLVGSKDVLLH